MSNPEHWQKKYIEEGFTHPYKCDKSPLGFKFKEKGLAFIHKNSNSIELN